VNAAKNRGGNDNITVVTIDVVDDGDLPQSASEALKTNPGVFIPSPIPPVASDEGLGKKGAGTSGLPDGRRSRSRRREDVPVVAKPRPITLRVVGFLAILIALVGGAGVAVALYARGTYFVGLDHDLLTVYKGRPGGLLWFQPTVAKSTGVKLTDVAASYQPAVREGKEEPSLQAALDYINNATTTTTSTTTTSTTAPTTTVATTVPHP
jgi:protein phosphatase